MFLRHLHYSNRLSVAELKDCYTFSDTCQVCLIRYIMIWRSVAYISLFFGNVLINASFLARSYYRNNSRYYDDTGSIFNSSAVRVPSIDIQTAEWKVELWFAITVPSWEKTSVAAVYIYNRRHDFDASSISSHHICLLQGSDSLPGVQGKKEKNQVVTRSVSVL